MIIITCVAGTPSWGIIRKSWMDPRSPRAHALTHTYTHTGTHSHTHIHRQYAGSTWMHVTFTHIHKYRHGQTHECSAQYGCNNYCQCALVAGSTTLDARGGAFSFVPASYQLLPLRLMGAVYLVEFARSLLWLPPPPLSSQPPGHKQLVIPFSASNYVTSNAISYFIPPWAQLPLPRMSLGHRFGPLHAPTRQVLGHFQARSGHRSDSSDFGFDTSNIAIRSIQRRRRRRQENNRPIQDGSR